MDVQTNMTSMEQASLPQETNIESLVSPTSADDLPKNRTEQISSTAPVSQQTQIHINRQNRHSKRLSLNFPILVPHARKSTDSPALPSSMSPSTTSASGTSTPQSQFQPYPFSAVSAITLPTPLTPPSESLEDFTTRQKSPSRRYNTHTRSRTLANGELNAIRTPSSGDMSPTESSTHLDFLTLLAGQERRVLELKEELSRAETELQTLKKQWAVHEASRKKGELRNGGAVKMDVLKSPSTNGVHTKSQVVKGHARSATMAAGLGLGLGIDEEENLSESTDDVNHEKEKRRSLMQEKFRRRGTTLEDGDVTTMMAGRRNGQRVFSGSRHTRTLSLLTSTPNLNGGDVAKAISATSLNKSAAVPTSSMDTDNPSNPDSQLSAMPSLSRSNSGFGRDLNFGKTYKDLASAASRRTIPQGADVLMKHGKVVVDGVRDGLWSFFEDIRQATVGEEAAREISAEDQAGDGPYRKGSGGSLNAGGKVGTSDARSKMGNQKSSEQSFWREFGIETPKGDRKKGAIDAEGVTRSKSQRTKRVPASCPKHGHGHKTNISTIGQERGAIDAPGTNTRSNEPDEANSTETRSGKNQQKKDHHISHSSTDSGDSRDSRNPPSLTMDSPFGGSSRNNDTDVDEGEEDETWDWKESDSPSQVRNKPLLTKEDSPQTINLTTNVMEQKGNHARGHSQEGYEWHALTR